MGFGALSTPHVLATEAGRRAYAAGGNAFDAALTAAVVLTVVYPHNTALGGDSVSLVRTGGRMRVVNATGPAPRAADAAVLAARHGARLPEQGVDTITVPGAVAAWKSIYSAGAALPWEFLFEEAIEHAERGVPVSVALGKNIAEFAGRFADHPGMASVFAPHGVPLVTGDVFVQPRLAESLRAIAALGPPALYGGEVGRQLVDGLRPLGSVLALNDLERYLPRIDEPLALPLGQHTVTTSPPNTQGFILLRALHQLHEAGIAAGDAVGDRAGFLASTMAEGNLLRDGFLSDPRFSRIELDQLVRGSFDERRRPLPAGPAVASGDTVGIAAADDDGNAVSLVQSLFSGFGSGILEESTGIIMQNRGSAFSLDPRSPNVIAPGKRPGHTLMPVMVQDAQGELRWVNATMGGKGQPQVHAQVLLRLLAGASPDEAVSAPRWMVGPRSEGEPPLTAYAESDLSASATESLLRAGFTVRPVPARTDWMGHMNVVELQGPLHRVAASDPRSDGSAIMVERG